MKPIHEEAIVTAISIKNRNLGYLRSVTSRVANSQTRQIFEALAENESVHLELFCTLFQGDEQELATILETNSIDADPYYCSLLDSLDGRSADFDALRIALREEQACIDLFTIYKDIIRVPHIRDAFAKTLDETSRHSDMIQDEYRRLHEVSRQKGSGCVCS